MDCREFAVAPHSPSLLASPGSSFSVVLRFELHRVSQPFTLALGGRWFASFYLPFAGVSVSVVSSVSVPINPIARKNKITFYGNILGLAILPSSVNHSRLTNSRVLSEVKLQVR